MNIVNFYKNKKSIWIYFMTSIVMVFLNFFNLSLSLKDFLALEEGKTVIILSNLFIPFIVLLFCSIEMGFCFYFISAAVGIGYDMKKCLKLSFFVLSSMPIMTFMDSISIMFFRFKFSDSGLIGNLGFIPFYIAVFYLIYKLVPEIDECLSKKQRTVFSVLGLIAAFFVTLMWYEND